MALNKFEDTETDKFEFLLQRATSNLEDERLELSNIKSDNYLPSSETILSIIGVISTFSLGYFFPDFVIFWIFSSFLLYSIIIIFSLIKPKRNSKSILSKVELEKFQRTRDEIIKNKDAKTFFYLLFEWFFIIGTPIGMAYGLIFISNIIICAYAYYTDIIIFENSIYISIIVSLLLSACYGCIYLISPYKFDCANSLLNLDKSVDDFLKLGLKGLIFVLIVGIILCLIFGFLLLAPFALIYFLFNDYNEVIFNSWSVLIFTILLQVIFFQFLQGRLTRRMVIKWKENKIESLKNEIIFPIEHHLFCNNEHRANIINLPFKRIYKKYWSLNLFVYKRMDFHGLFVKHLLIPNLQIFQSDEDMDSLREYLKIEGELDTN